MPPLSPGNRTLSARFSATRARAEMVTTARRLLLEDLADMGRPFAEVLDQSVVVDHADDSMSVTLDISPGELAHFGTVEVADSVSVKADYIESFVPWEEGEVFDRRKVNELRRLLLDTGLFASVAIERPNEPTSDGRMPVTIRVDERKHRSIGLAGRWSTDQGVAVEAQWEHRNLFGRGELLSLSGEIGEIKQEFIAAFEKPNFLRRNQALLLNGALAHEDTDAFEGPLTRYFGGVRRRINQNWKIVAGVPIEFSNLSDLQGSRRFTLVGLEVRGDRDTSNDRFDPNAGSRLNLSLLPFYGTGENRVNFLTGRLGVTGYHAVDNPGALYAGGPCEARFHRGRIHHDPAGEQALLRGRRVVHTRLSLPIRRTPRPGQYSPRRPLGVRSQRRASRQDYRHPGRRNLHRRR